MYSTPARIALAKPDPRAAASLFHKSYALHKDLGHVPSAANALLSVAECYFDMKRLTVARRFCEIALRSLRDEPRSLTRATALAVKGKIDEAAGRTEQATAFWREAADVAKEYRDRVLRFKIDLFLFRRAARDGDRASARAIQRRLTRLSPWIPPELPELSEFRDLLRNSQFGTDDLVSVSQRESLPNDN